MTVAKRSDAKRPDEPVEKPLPPQVWPFTKQKLSEKALAQVVQEGWFVVDCGGGHGTMGRACINAGADVLTIEASSANIKSILEKRPETVILHAAVSDAPGMLSVYEKGGALQRQVWPHNDTVKEEEPVQAITLDTLEFMVPDLIKMDIQGYEHRAMKGARKILEQRKTRWVVEVWPKGIEDSGDSLDEWIALMRQYLIPQTWSNEALRDCDWDDVAPKLKAAKGGTYCDLWLRPNDRS